MTSKEFLLLKTELQFIKKQNEIIIKDFSKKLESLQNDVEKLQNQNQNLKEKLEQVSERRNEQYYQRYLEKLLSATHQKTKHGITDITTDTQIIEIKHWRNYKSALGQLLSYKDSKTNKNKSLAVYFFGVYEESLKETVVELFQQKEISIYEFIDTEDGIKVKELYKKDKPELESELEIQNENIDDARSFENWLKMNISYKKDSILKLQDCIECYFNTSTDGENVSFRQGTKLGSKKASLYKIKIENFIKENFKTVNFNYQNTTINGKQYRGWMHLQIKNNFTEWLDQNIVYKKDSVLKLYNVCENYLGIEDDKYMHSSELTGYKIEIENWIKEHFPDLKSDYGFVWSNDKSVRGWKHLDIKLA